MAANVSDIQMKNVTGEIFEDHLPKFAAKKSYLEVASSEDLQTLKKRGAGEVFSGEGQTVIHAG